MRWVRRGANLLLRATVGAGAAERSELAYADIRQWLRALFDGYLASSYRLASYRGSYSGERCFIVGCGPSLNSTDLSLLKDEYTFGLNRIYLLFERLGFCTTFLVSVNRNVIEQCGQEILRVPCQKIISWSARDLIESRDEVVFVRPTSGPRFCSNLPIQGVWEGATVTYVAMQLAYYMGFSQVILVGVDHSFATQGPPHKLITSEGDDPNHFDPSYFGRGYRWQLPDLETSELAYQMAKAQFERAGREIVDATVGGKLKVFSKIPYDSLFAA